MLPGLDNHGMGTIFEELIRRFNEENNEEAGEHFTPRDVVTLMADLVFRPVEDAITSTTYTLYDGACGTGGMLTVGEERLLEIGEAKGETVSAHLYGQEVNGETYAIAKADLLLKGEGEEAENFAHGTTLASDAFPAREFDFMLSNPPYGKSWKNDRERMGGKKEMSDPRFIVSHGDQQEFRMITRSSDGQMMFLANKLAKMKHHTDQGSRIAHIHNGSSLFTGKAGSGESNIRRYILENDWLEAIIALPLNIFYNTGIATYIWVLTNRKPEHRQGIVQLVDATEWFEPLRKNLGEKNCELSDADIQRIVDTHLAFEENEHSRIFPNEHFGYREITVERPLRLKSQFTKEAVDDLRFNYKNPEVRRAVYARFGTDLYERFGEIRPKIEAFLDGEHDGGDPDNPPGASLTTYQRKKMLDPSTWQDDRRLYELGCKLHPLVGEAVFDDHNAFRDRIREALDEADIKTYKTERKAIWEAMSWPDEDAQPVIDKVYKRKQPDPLHGIYEVTLDGERRVVRYESDTDLRDTERVPLLEEGGVEGFFRREVQPYVPDAWIDPSRTQIGYEISFNRVFYEPPELRSLDEIRADIEALEDETEGLLDEVLVETEEVA
jgi:type I restriction enzyme M protein